ncbi:MAG: 50S ribosomal protein L11 methyltransferase [Pseudomonadota bacterium]
MPTFTALTTLMGEAPAKAMGEAMERLDPEPVGVAVSQVEDGSGLWEVGGYFPEDPDRAGLALLAVTYGAGDFAVSELPETDWVAKVRRELPPVVAGRFFVHGGHDVDKVPEGSVALLIEAALAFGTGHHATTLGCLRALDRLLAQGVVCESVADIGCGTAVLAMAAAHVWPNPVVASDIDEVAVEVAQANVRANALDGKVACIKARGFEADALRQAAPFDLIFANILMAPLIDLAPDMARHAASGGIVLLSGILNRQTDDVVSAYRAQGFSLAQQEELGEWTTLTLRARK